MRGCLFDAPGIYYFHLLNIDNLFHIIFFRAIRQAPITPASPPNREGTMDSCWVISRSEYLCTASFTGCKKRSNF